jgi:hypothetical protein
MEWVGKILCKLGIHKWHKVEKVHIGGWGMCFKYDQTRCKRCDKLKK